MSDKRLWMVATAMAAAGAGMGLPVPAHATGGTLIAAGDEWLLTQTAYTGIYETGTRAFVNSIAATFGGSRYLLLTGDAPTGGQAGLQSLAAQLASLGKTVLYAPTLPGSLAGYDAVFHFGQAIAPAALDGYVENGGNLYVSLGGGYFGSAAGEAAAWNPFLAQYGLVAGSVWGPTPGFVNVTVTHGPPDVDNLIWGYGQTIDALPRSSGVSYVRGLYPGSRTELGLVGTSRALVDGTGNGAVPEPATWLTMLVGFGLAGRAMRRQQAARRVTVRYAA